MPCGPCPNKSVKTITIEILPIDQLLILQIDVMYFVVQLVESRTDVPHILNFPIEPSALTRRLKISIGENFVNIEPVK